MSEDGEVKLPRAQRVLGAVFGVALTGIGLVCCILAVRFPADLAAHDAFLDQLLREGAVVKAELTDKRVETTTAFPIGSRGGRSTAESVSTRYAFQFQTPAGSTVSGRSSISGRLPASAKTVRIYYLTDDPNQHAPFHIVEGKRLGFNFDTAVAALALVFVGGLGLLFGGVGVRLIRAAYRGRAKRAD
ncbi:MAG: DUF3592 domain-containing protein [Pseudomonadota bacterium]